MSGGRGRAEAAGGLWAEEESPRWTGGQRGGWGAQARVCRRSRRRCGKAGPPSRDHVCLSMTGPSVQGKRGQARDMAVSADRRTNSQGSDWWDLGAGWM